MTTELCKTWQWLLTVMLLTALIGLGIRQIQLNRVSRAHWISCRSKKTFIQLSLAVFADERGLNNGEPVDLATFNRYLTTNALLGMPLGHVKCPAGGSYSINSVGEFPDCSYTNAVTYWWWNAQERRFRRLTVHHN